MIKNLLWSVFILAACVIIFSAHLEYRTIRSAAAITLPPVASVSHHENTPHKKTASFFIYITIDDGPSAGSTIINQISLSDSVPMNVFLIGRNVCLTRERRDMVQAYRENPLVQIGNHSYSHAERHYNKFFKDPEVVLEDFNRSRDSLHLDNTLCRLPGRNIFRLPMITKDDHGNGREAADTLFAKGYRLFGWDIEWHDKRSKVGQQLTGQEMYDKIRTMLTEHKTSSPDKLILLLHEKQLEDPSFREGIEQFITLVKTDPSMQFDQLSHYMN